MTKKTVPPSFVAVGAASVLLRHALFDLQPLFEDLRDKLAAAHDDMKANGIARMEIAPGERLLHNAAGAALDVMAAHDSWRAMLERHGIALPTDAEIMAHHKAQHAAKGLGVLSATVDKLTTLGNFR
jgi:hypothetical protein